MQIAGLSPTRPFASQYMKRLRAKLRLNRSEEWKKKGKQMYRNI